MADDSDEAVDDRELAAYRDLVEMASDALFAIDGDGRFETANGVFLRLTGYERGELVEMTATTILADDDVREWERRVSLLRTETGDGTESWTTGLVTKHGTEVPVDVELTPVRTDEGGPDGFIGVVKDIRERQRRKQNLTILNRVLRHNIRNRMNLILANATTLQGVEDEGYRTAAERIEAVGEEVINLSEKARKAHELLDMPSDEDCRRDLVEMTREVMTAFGITHPNATVETDFPDAAWVRAPPSFDAALTELLENGVVHHPSGDGPVTVAIEADEEFGYVRVRDRCEPVPGAVIDCLQQGEEGPLQHNEGLGLWIVHWVVESVGGTLSFGRRADGSGNEIMLRFDAIEA